MNVARSAAALAAGVGGMLGGIEVGEFITQDRLEDRVQAVHEANERLDDASLALSETKLNLREAEQEKAAVVSLLSGGPNKEAALGDAELSPEQVEELVRDVSEARENQSIVVDEAENVSLVIDLNGANQVVDGKQISGVEAIVYRQDQEIAARQQDVTVEQKNVAFEENMVDDARTLARYEKEESSLIRGLTGTLGAVMCAGAGWGISGAVARYVRNGRRHNPERKLRKKESRKSVPPSSYGTEPASDSHAPNFDDILTPTK